MRAYLLAESLVVDEMNAEGNAFVVGIPSLTGFVGLAHALQRSLQEAGWNVAIPGVGLVVQDYQVEEGRPRFPPQMNAKPDRKAVNEGTPPPMVEEVKARGELSLCFAVDFAPGEELEESEDAWNDFRERGGEEDLRGRLLAGRVCGGTCHEVGGVHSFWRQDELKRHLAWLGGSALVDRADLLQTGGADGETDGKDALDRFFDANALNITEDGQGRRSYARNQPGWVVPLALGFRAIEAPTARAGARGGYPHVFAEPLTGLGELVAVPRLAAREEFPKGSGFLWGYHVDTERGLYAARPL